MSAHVLLNLLNKLGIKIRREALPSFLPVFPIEFRILLVNFALKRRNFGFRKSDNFMDVNA